MSLYSEWTEHMGEEESREKASFYNNYIDKETEIYTQLLRRHDYVEKGTFNELAAVFEADDLVFTGFLDGVNTSLKTEINLESLTGDSELELNIDYEKLYFNMYKAKAKWLYSLDEWEDVLDASVRTRITNEYRSTIIAKSDKVGRNDPCPCGSGKKYKNCCGKAS